jgi:type VI secretion system protein ImpC
MRQPYGLDTYAADSFRFEEDIDEADDSKYLWGSAVYSFGCCLTRTFAKHYWCGGLIGPEGGGLVHSLITHRYFSADGSWHLKGPTDIVVTDRLEDELSSLGFIPLVHCRDTDYAAFFSMQSCHKAARANSFDIAPIAAPLPTQLPYVFATSRFLHYLKAIVRDKVGAFRNTKHCEDYLNRWISSYVLLDDAATPEAQAQKPLREAHIEVSEIPGKATTYQARIFLQPHFQFDQRTSPAVTLAELSTHATEDSKY